MVDRLLRTELLIGKEALDTLAQKTVAVFGVGGVGGYVVEALARSGVGKLVLIDNDVFSATNINRQILATTETIGCSKVETAGKRVHLINPDAEVKTIQKFYLPDNRDEFDFEEYDYVVDAIDTVTAKLDIIVRCKEMGIPVISSMGTGNKMNPTMLEVSDISKTMMDPLAKVMRRELKKRNIKDLKVVWSKEKPLKPLGNANAEGPTTKRAVPGSSAFVPAAAGLIIASEVVKDLISFDPDNRI